MLKLHPSLISSLDVWTIANGEIQVKTLKIRIEMQWNIVPH